MTSTTTSYHSEGLNSAVVALIATTSVAGAAIAAVAVSHWDNDNLPLLAILAGFAALLVRYDVALFYHTRVSVTVVPILVAGTVVGLPGVVVVVLAAEMAAYLGRGRPYYKSLFNAGVLLVSGAAYIGVLESPLGNSGGDWPGILYPAIAGILVNFFVNSVLVSCVIALTGESAVLTVWRDNFRSLLPHYALLGVLVAGMVSVYDSAGIATMALVFVPVIFIRFGIQLQQAHTELQAAHQRILHLAYHDGLTDLPNRQLFEDRLAVALDEASQNQDIVAVMFLDLDMFKRVNDTLGHSAGDRLLQGIGQSLRGFIREGDCAARLGGDEFALMFPGLINVEEALHIAERLLKIFQAVWELDGRKFRSTASIGLAIYPGDGDDSRTLLRNADAAMYRAKSRGGNRYQRYCPATTADAEEETARGDLLPISWSRPVKWCKSAPASQLGQRDAVPSSTTSFGSTK